MVMKLESREFRLHFREGKDEIFYYFFLHFRLLFLVCCIVKLIRKERDFKIPSDCTHFCNTVNIETVKIPFVLASSLWKKTNWEWRMAVHINPQSFDSLFDATNIPYVVIQSSTSNGMEGDGTAGRLFFSKRQAYSTRRFVWIPPKNQNLDSRMFNY